jgi:hypothetical protein
MNQGTNPHPTGWISQNWMKNNRRQLDFTIEIRCHAVNSSNEGSSFTTHHSHAEFSIYQLFLLECIQR